MTEHTPADSVIRLFERTAPAAAAIVAPWVARLFHALEQGHTFIYLSRAEADSLHAAAPLVGQDGSSPLVLHGNRLFIARHWQEERALAAQIRRLARPVALPATPADYAPYLHQWFSGASARDQQAAAALTLIRPFVLINGGPGTGKTTTVAKLLALLCHFSGSLNIALTAPTGKAAARLSQALHGALSTLPDLPERTATTLNALNGQTVHRLLGLTPPQMQPEFHANNRLPLDVVVVDEASMLDSQLMLQLLYALPDGCRVILLGDGNQLPPVEAGAVLQALDEAAAELPASERTLLTALLPPDNPADAVRSYSARLRVSHRFDGSGGIGALAEAVLSEEGARAWQQFARFPEALSCHPHRTPAQLTAACYRAQQTYWQAVDNGDAAAAFVYQSELAVLAARRRDSEQFNRAYRDLLAQQGRIQADAPWFAGQILMITRNDPATGLFNGDIGIVLADPTLGLHACFSNAGHLRRVPLSLLPACDDAFAITVHKSQGSEYRSVWLLAPDDNADGNDFTRALLYTAITRAKQQFAYWGGADAFQAACTRSGRRRSALTTYLSTL